MQARRQDTKAVSGSGHSAQPHSTLLFSEEAASQPKGHRGYDPSPPARALELEGRSWGYLAGSVIIVTSSRTQIWELRVQQEAGAGDISSGGNHLAPKAYWRGKPLKHSPCPPLDQETFPLHCLCPPLPCSLLSLHKHYPGASQVLSISKPGLLGPLTGRA